MNEKSPEDKCSAHRPDASTVAGATDAPKSLRSRLAPLYAKDTGTVKGRGVFAAAGFEPGDVIEVCPMLALKTPYSRIPGELQRMVFHWSFLAQIDDVSCALALGFGSLYNHANPANARYKADAGGECLVISAARRIAPDEEITINYNAAGGEPSSEEDNWFTERGVELYAEPQAAAA